jgi:6-phosphogluconolactonase
MSEYAYITLQTDNKILSLLNKGDLWTPTQELAVSGGPAPIALSPDHRFIYTGLRDEPGVAVLEIGAEGRLNILGRIALESHPCHISVDRSSRFLLSAYFQAGMITVHMIENNGIPHNKPVERIKTARTAHMIMTDPQNRFVFVPHRDLDCLLQYLFDANSGHLEPNEQDRMNLPTGTGPRHFCFHPNNRWLFISNELSASVTACSFNSKKGTASPIQTVSTLPDDYEGENKCAQIHITPNGRYLYVSNRGHNSIAGFCVNPESGRLERLSITPTEPIPRAFNISTSGYHLLVSGRDSGRLLSYHIDEHSGAIKEVSFCSTGRRVMWICTLDLVEKAF